MSFVEPPGRRTVKINIGAVQSHRLLGTAQQPAPNVAPLLGRCHEQARDVVLWAYRDEPADHSLMHINPGGRPFQPISPEPPALFEPGAPSRRSVGPPAGFGPDGKACMAVTIVIVSYLGSMVPVRWPAMPASPAWRERGPCERQIHEALTQRMFLTTAKPRRADAIRKDNSVAIEATRRNWIRTGKAMGEQAIETSTRTGA